MSKQKKNQTERELANLGWPLIIFLWMCWWPLGMGLTVGKILARKKLERDEENEAMRRNYGYNYDYGEQTPGAAGQAQHTPGPGEYGYRPADPRHHRDYTGTTRAAGSPAKPWQTATGRPIQPEAGQTAAQAQRTATSSAPSRTPPTAAQSKASATRKWLVPVLLILGAVFAVGGLSMLAEGIDFLVYLGQLWDGWTFTAYLLPGLLSLVGGCGLLGTGLKKRRAAKQETLLTTVVGPRDSVSLKELSAATGMSQKQTLRIVQSAIEHGLFGGSAYVDMLSKTLVVRGSAPAPAAAKAPEAPKAAKQPAKEDKYQAILRQLREVNDAIPGKEMSDKIDRMELVSARIFELVQQDPKKEAQLARFMDYYLPTSLKLLNTYADLDKQGMSGENIDETKRSIEDAMDLLVTAFENQLDKLYESDALDVSSEISALQGMLNLDGLTPAADFTAAAEQWQKDIEI